MVKIYKLQLLLSNKLVSITGAKGNSNAYDDGSHLVVVYVDRLREMENSYK